MTSAPAQPTAPSKKHAWAWSAVFVAAIGVAATLAFLGSAYQPRTEYQLSDRLSELEFVQQHGDVWIDRDRGPGQDLVSPQDFLNDIQARQAARDGRWPVIRRALDITSTTGLLWIAFGLSAQVLFAGRMIVQWVVSEKAKRSTVPIAFWWMSLIGSSMLLCYFGWRREWVGIVGQSTGWFVYVRNLWLIYKPAAPAAVEQTADPTGPTDPGPPAV
ncbi:MAG: lipid-A-disaccharide synthase N-terminal domain-containing protein [Planctomycetota bacterium]